MTIMLNVDDDDTSSFIHHSSTVFILLDSFVTEKMSF